MAGAASWLVLSSDSGALVEQGFALYRKGRTVFGLEGQMQPLCACLGDVVAVVTHDRHTQIASGDFVAEI